MSHDIILKGGQQKMHTQKKKKKPHEAKTMATVGERMIAENWLPSRAS